MSTIRLFGVAALDGEGHEPLAPGTSLIAFRDLGAVVGNADSIPVDIGDAEIEQYHKVIDAVFARRSVLPAPLGVLFHSEETLLRWMELHYVVLSEGLAFVDGRCQVRVHIVQDLKTAAATGDATLGIEGARAALQAAPDGGRTLEKYATVDRITEVRAASTAMGRRS